MAIKTPLQIVGRRRTTIETGEGLTEQAHKRETDMNWILRDYQKTGRIQHAKEHAGRYDDVTGADFQSAMLIVTRAQQMFDELPSTTRKRFGNDPRAFLEFVQDPKNEDELRRMGMLKGNDGLNSAGADVGSPTPEKTAENGTQAVSEGAPEPGAQTGAS